MSTINSEPDTPTVCSENSIGNSSQWSIPSISTKSTSKSITAHSAIHSSKSRFGGCLPIAQALKYVFFRKNKRKSNLLLRDNDSLLANIKYESELIQEFLSGFLNARFKRHENQIKLPDSYNSKPLSQPTAKVWAATYFLKLCHDTKMQGAETESGFNMDFEKWKQLRIRFVSLCWEMHMAQQIAREYQHKFVRFASDMSNAIKQLQKTLLAHLPTLPKKSKFAAFKASLNSKLDQSNSTTWKKRTNSPLLFEVIKTQTHRNNNFTLSIDSDGDGNTIHFKNRPCSKIGKDLAEEIICGLLSSGAASLESFYTLLETSGSRISNGAVILKAEGVPGGGWTKDVTCYTALRSVKELSSQALFSGGTPKLNEKETSELLGYIAGILRKWQDYLNCSHAALDQIQEFCEMISICYLFAGKQLSILLPEIDNVLKEVNIMLKFQKTNPNFLSRSHDCSLKRYAIETLLDECASTSNAIPVETNNGHSSKSRHSNNNYEDALLSTKYHLVLQEFPLGFDSPSGRYLIRLRHIPDLENVNSDMLLSDEESHFCQIVGGIYKNSSINKCKSEKQVKFVTFSGNKLRE